MIYTLNRAMHVIHVSCKNGKLSAFCTSDPVLSLKANLQDASLSIDDKITIERLDYIVGRVLGKLSFAGQSFRLDAINHNRHNVDLIVPR